MSKTSASVLVQILGELLGSSVDRETVVIRFQTLVWDEEDTIENDAIDGILRDLAYDLDFYAPDPKQQAEDRAYFGDDRLEEEVRSALAKLAGVGLPLA